MSSSGRGEAELAGILERLAAAAGLAFPETARVGLLQYVELLLTWGQRINLTGARTAYDVVAEHLPDAFALAARLASHESAAAGDPVTRGAMVDVGSGGGLPAIPLAILRPTSQISLFEPTAKKVAFLRTAIRQLGLGNRLRVMPRRIELPLDPELDGAFEVALSRATLPPPQWLTLAWRLVRPGGRVFALTTHRLTEWPPELVPVHVASYARPDHPAHRWLTELRRST